MAGSTPGKVSGTIFQINVSDGGVPKLAVREAVSGPLGLTGDRQRNQEHHGGPERALCLYPLEHILALQAEGHPIFPGSVGENLTISGLDWSQMAPGSRWRLGGQVEIEVTRYTTPCQNIAESFSGRQFSRILQEKNPGWSRVYARVITAGPLRTGDPIERIGRDEAG